MLRDRGIEIGPGQGRVLFALLQGDEIPISELAKRTSLGKSTLTSALDKLETADYVTRIPEQDRNKDRRQIRINLTDRSKELEKEYVRVSQEMTDLFYSGFSDTEIDLCEAYLQRLLDNLEAAGQPK